MRAEQHIPVEFHYYPEKGWYFVVKSTLTSTGFISKRYDSASRAAAAFAVYANREI